MTPGDSGSSSSFGVFSADVGASSSLVGVPGEEFVDAHTVLTSVDGAEASAVPSVGSAPCSAASCSILNFVSGPGSVGGGSSSGAYHSVAHSFVPGAVSFPAFSDADPAGRGVCAAVSPVDAPCTIPDFFPVAFPVAAVVELAAAYRAGRPLSFPGWLFDSILADVNRCGGALVA
ncbi:hypothetical protein ACOSP7_012389 [Xanthoceras sorbifolium]